MYQCKVDVDMLNAVKSVLADVSSVSPSSEQRLLDSLAVMPAVLCKQHMLPLINQTAVQTKFQILRLCYEHYYPGFQTFSFLFLWRERKPLVMVVS